MNNIEKSHKLRGVCYDMRGETLLEARRLEEEGHRILKLNIGNPAPFGFQAPEEILQDVMRNLSQAQGYCDSKGLFAARKAVMQYYQKKNVADVDVEDVFLGNGASELIVMAMQGLLNDGDEILVPTPDYPLWTAAVSLSSGKPVYYRCDESNGWQPDLEDIAKKITKNTRGIVVINPNNPTGAVYSKAVLQGIVDLAREHGLIVFADEIYDKIVYDDAVHFSMASLADDVFFVTFNGLSKSYRVAGFRTGWMVVSGAKQFAKNYIEGLEILSSMRLCSNVPTQYAIQTALGGYQSIHDLVAKDGKLCQQRDFALKKLSQIPGISCVKPKGALYLFPKIDLDFYGIKDDKQFCLELLRQKHILVTHGSAFNWVTPDHFRMVFLPSVDVLDEAIDQIGDFLSQFKK